MSTATRNRVLFGLFFASGFCGLVYQVVWLRLAFASFGITTAVLSIVVSVFMLGLGAGAMLAGGWIERWRRATGRSALVLYGLVELAIGTGAWAVAALFRVGATSLLPVGDVDSAAYHALSGLLLAAILLPWCTLMGATFPLVMAFVRERDDGASTSFSFLYLANVLGAALGTVATAVVLVETLGFSATLAVAGATNALVALTAFATASAHPRPAADVAASPPTSTPSSAAADRVAMAALFATGFASMAFEVVWTRAYTPILRTYVYSFAALLSVYLVATFAGSWAYRRSLRSGRTISVPTVLALVVLTSVLPVFCGDPRFIGVASRFVPARVAVLLGIVPFCGALGYLTPQLVDRASGGDPRRAGRAYAVNVAGCILGPLFVSYGLLPALGARMSLLALVLPLAAVGAAALRGSTGRRALHFAIAGATAALVAVAAVAVRSYEEGANVVGEKVVRRDATATVISHGEGRGKKLLVNGMGITAIDRCTKFMAHLPMAAHPHAEKALVICFGMGTTFRALRTWDVDVTAVELVPSVRDAFSYYHEDAAQVLASPRGRIVIDDGRRFLQRTGDMFDIVTLDPPPPVEAAGSSLLYTREFYRLMKTRMRPGAILQAWFPGLAADDGTAEAVLRTLRDEFPYVRAYASTKPGAYHYLASMSPIAVPDVDAFVAKMPEAARRDLVEWNRGEDRDVTTYVRMLLGMEVPVDSLLVRPGDERVTDDRPYNEYYLLRRWRAAR
jgi:predicted membrane-bound spermidine synthase